MIELTVEELAAHLAGEVVGDGTRAIRRVAPLEAAGPEELSFVAQRRYLPYVAATRAAAVLVSEELAGEVPATLTQVRVRDAHAALGEALRLLHPPRRPPAGLHPTAIVGPDVELGDGVGIGPYAVIGEGSVLGAGVVVGAHVVVGEACRIGADSVLHPHVTLYPGVVLGARCTIHSGARLGKEGFGYVWTGTEHRRVPQVGGCRLGDDVDVGANVTIDRGSIGDTLVGDGTKIDNLVQLGHNVRVGRHVILVSQVGVAGSCEIGDGAVLGGQVGVSGHLRIGAGARVGAQAGVIGDVPAGATVSGYPARPHREALRMQAAAARLPQLQRRLQQVEKELSGPRPGSEPQGEPGT